MRALVLALALVLVAPAAWAGIVPSFGSAHVDSFRNGQFPDANFNGITGSWLRHQVAVGDSFNAGADTSSAGTASTSSFRIGGAATVIHRQILKLTFGSYIPSSAIIDSILMRETFTVVEADSAMAAVVLRGWVAGSGDGEYSDIAAKDTTGVSWRSYNYPTASTWGLRGADSCYTSLPGTGTARLTAHSAMEQALGGTLNYDGAQDREGSWHYIGPILGTGVKTFNVSFMRFIYNNLSAAQNYGIIIRSVNGEGLSGNHRCYGQGPWSNTIASRTIFIVYWHDTRQAIQIGGDN